MKTKITKGSNNIFADLGVKNPEEMLAKSQLAAAIIQVIEKRKLTQKKAAELLGTDQSHISRLKHGRELRRFTFDTLLSWLNKLDRNIVMTVKKKSKNQEMGLIKVAV